MSEFAQPESFRVTTPLGENVLLIEGFHGEERISKPYEIAVELVASVNVEIPFDKLIGQPMSIRLAYDDSGERFLHGIVAKFGEGSRYDDLVCYHATIVPSLWFLSMRKNCRIYQNQTIPDILKVLFASFDVRFELRAQYMPHNYCVQYCETDLDFAQRLMEEEGIFYYFEHSADGHVMVIGDSSTLNPEIGGPSSIVYDPAKNIELRVERWRKTQKVCSSKTMTWDHAFQLPGQNMQAEHPSMPMVRAGRVEHKLTMPINANLEMFEYPANHAHRFDGITSGGGEDGGALQHNFTENARLARVRIEQRTAESVVIRGKSTAIQFCAGRVFSLDQHPNADGRYLIVAVEHDIRVNNYRPSSRRPRVDYSNRFRAIPVDLPYRPPATKDKPVILALQTATVVGTAGEEITTDKYGRVKVQFHWDRYGKKDMGSSCWIRVSQAWAGSAWGGIQIPRVGQEVIVAFIEGDPDWPIIVGNTYNPSQMPPYELPANRTLSGMKSRTKFGDPTKYNEFRFQDLAGQEHVNLHAERDYYMQCENDHVEHVGNSRTVTIGVPAVSIHGSGAGGSPGEGIIEPPAVGGLSGMAMAGAHSMGGAFHDMTVNGWQRHMVTGWKEETVEQDSMRHIMGSNFETTDGDTNRLTNGNEIKNIMGNEERTTHGSNTETTMGNETHTLMGNQTHTVMGNQTHTTMGNQTEMVEGNQSETTHGSVEEETSGNHVETVMGNVVDTVFGNETSTVFGGYEHTVFGISTETVIGIHNEITLALKNHIDFTHDGLHIPHEAHVIPADHETVTGISLALLSGGLISLTAPTIALNAGAILINGIAVAINAAGGLNMAASALGIEAGGITITTGGQAITTAATQHTGILRVT